MSNKKGSEPQLHVGIMAATELRFTLNGGFRTSGGMTAEGSMTATIGAGGNTVRVLETDYAELIFEPTEADSRFELENVVIGVDFHWQRRERQTFEGCLKIIADNGKLHAINIIDVESYLKSVISSEMSATASPQLLRAHAVISRSWVLAQIAKRGRLENGEKGFAMRADDKEICRWQDREDHTLFDVCADDHCQRYQGTLRQTTAAVAEAIDDTRGIVLTDRDGALCDARFSKCCGGVFEEFENCWEPRHFHYLEAARDSDTPAAFPDLTVEENARMWILNAPEAYCNTSDNEILSQVLNDYDRETPDFYRWHVSYTQSELSELIARRTGIDFGGIKALESLARGTSGRITRLKISGTRRTMIIGKELEIRHALSESHLYSSAFVVEPSADTNAEKLPVSFTLHGAGWGHGVGLCQIGAAVMGAKGIGYREILAHYFHNSQLHTLY